MKQVKIGLICVALEGERIDLATEFAEKARESLAERELQLVSQPDAYTLTAGQVIDQCRRAVREGAHAVVFLIGTWLLADHIIDAAKECTVPIGIWGVPEPVSFSSVGVNVIHGAMDEMGIRHRLFYGMPGEDQVEDRIVKFARAAAAFAACRKARFGLIGGRTISAYPTAADPNQVKAMFGMEIEHIDQLVLLEKARAVKKEETDRLAERVKAAYGEVKVSPETLRKSVSIYAALKEIKSEYGLDLLSVKCIGEFMDAYASCCLALSMLCDEGVTAACQCSINAAISMFIMAQFSKLPPYFGDISVVLKDDKIVRLINCGSIPGKLAPDYDSIEIVEQYAYMGAGRGACTLFCCREGDITFGTLGRVQGEYVMNIATGQAFEQPVEQLKEVRSWAQGFVRLDGDPMKFFHNIRSNHSTACYGNVAEELEEFCWIAGVTAQRNI